jgi:hypothetical protein
MTYKKFIKLIEAIHRVKQKDFLTLHTKLAEHNSSTEGELAWQWFRDNPIQFFECHSNGSKLNQAVYRLAIKKYL